MVPGLRVTLLNKWVPAGKAGASIPENYIYLHQKGSCGMARSQQWAGTVGTKPGGLPGGRALVVKMGGTGWMAGTAHAEPGKGQSLVKPCLAPSRDPHSTDLVLRGLTKIPPRRNFVCRQVVWPEASQASEVSQLGSSLQQVVVGLP